MKSSYIRSFRKFFQSLPVYSKAADPAINFLVNGLLEQVQLHKGEHLTRLQGGGKDFYFLVDGYLKEMYKNLYTSEDELFNIIPPLSFFVNEDTLFDQKRPSHYFVAYTKITYLVLPFAVYEEALHKYPVMAKLYLSGTAEIQKSRRSRLLMLRMTSTVDKINWVLQERPDIFQKMDKSTLAQYIGVSRASLYRALEKS